MKFGNKLSFVKLDSV